MAAGRRVGDGEGYSDIHLITILHRRIRLAWNPVQFRRRRRRQAVGREDLDQLLEQSRRSEARA